MDELIIPVGALDSLRKNDGELRALLNTMGPEEGTVDKAVSKVKGWLGVKGKVDGSGK